MLVMLCISQWNRLYLVNSNCAGRSVGEVHWIGPIPFLCHVVVCCEALSFGRLIIAPRKLDFDLAFFSDAESFIGSCEICHKPFGAHMPLVGRW